jgi:hypothetical protein
MPHELTSDKIMQLGLGFWDSKTFLSPIELGAFTELAKGLGQRLSFYPGDFFKDSLPSTEVIIMAHILHNLGLEEKRQLIAKAHAALPKGGVLIVCEDY